jgi:hypothetical protein
MSSFRCAGLYHCADDFARRQTVVRDVVSFRCEPAASALDARPGKAWASLDEARLRQGGSGASCPNAPRALFLKGPAHFAMAGCALLRGSRHCAKGMSLPGGVRRLLN